MSVRAATKGQIDVSLEPSEVSECVMFAVIECEADVFHRNVNCLNFANNCGDAGTKKQKWCRHRWGFVM